MNMMTDEEEEKDPSVIPEDIKEFIRQAHEERQDSRPDEGWRIMPGPKPEAIDAPYKQDEEDMPESDDVLDQLKSVGMNFDEGGVIPDSNQELQDVADAGTKPLGMPPLAAPAPPMASKPMAPAPMSAPAQAMPAAPAAAPTDQAYMDRANKLLGLNPNQQAGFMKLLGNNAQKGQIGAGLAGIGDAIASGGTLGKVNPGGLHSAEELIQNKTNEGLQGMQTIRGNQEKALDVGEKLRGNDPFSPEIQKALVTQFHIPRALANAPRETIFKMLDPIAQTQLKEAELSQEAGYKNAALDLQKQQLKATVDNQKAEREHADKEEGLKTDTEAAKHWLMHPVDAKNANARLAAGTSGMHSDERVTVISPTGQVGHIPASQLEKAKAKGYRQQ